MKANKFYIVDEHLSFKEPDLYNAILSLHSVRNSTREAKASTIYQINSENIQIDSKAHCIPRAICDVFGRCYSLRRLQAPTGEEFDHTVKSNRAHITYKRIKGNKLQFLSIHTRTSFSFVLAWSQGQWRALPRCSSGVLLSTNQSPNSSIIQGIFNFSRY